LRLILVLGVISLLFSACHRDPNVRKQKYFKSGQQYFEQGKYREAAIEFQTRSKLILIWRGPLFTGAIVSEITAWTGASTSFGDARHPAR